MMNIRTSQHVQFGNIYKFYNEDEALKKQKSLKKQGVDSEMLRRSSDGMLPVLTYLVYTDENGTQDLTNFRKRRPQ